MPSLEDDRIGNFLFRFGYISGCLYAPDIQDYLRERGVTDGELKSIQKAHNAIINAFYREPAKVFNSPPKNNLRLLICIVLLP